jgi:hypothetical protein
VITLTVVFCLVLNNTQCRTLVMVPEDYRAITSIEDCLMGGVIGGMKFTLDHSDYVVKGYRCSQEPNDLGAWFRGQPH